MNIVAPYKDIWSLSTLLIRTRPRRAEQRLEVFNGEDEAFCERTLSFLESVGTPEQDLAPHREALDR
jgi:hypothetical protein